MYGVMRTVRCADQVVEVEHAITSKFDIVNRYRVYMVNEYSPLYLTTLDTKVATIIPNYDVVTNAPPFGVMVENLIQISVVPECLCSNRPAEL